MRILAIDREKCTGCGICQTICSIAKKGAAQPSEARIRVRQDRKKMLQVVTVCQHCVEPACQSACLMECIHKNPVTGLVIRDQRKCFACSACAVACPISAPVLDSDQDVLVSCDLCNGDPACIKVCPHNAIHYEEIGQISEQTRTTQGMRFFGACDEEVQW